MSQLCPEKSSDIDRNTKILQCNVMKCEQQGLWNKKKEIDLTIIQRI